MHGRVLAIGGSDCSGGAGVQADIKTIAALDGYAMTAITAITVQDTHGVHAIEILPPALVAAQIAAVLDDIGADAIKLGMLGEAATVEAVAGVLAAKAHGVAIIVDPVMVAKGGTTLNGRLAVERLRASLLPLATLLTPNVPEAEALGGGTVADVGALAAVATRLRTLGVPAVLLKGGHLDGPEVVDALATEAGVCFWRAPRLASRHTHGTGCTLASAVATGLAQGMPLQTAVQRAHAYVQAALFSAPGLGGGHGPLNHAVTLDPARLAALG
jgi:hydroxymethylpyrimidine/phosphomethylpyrimidine kinase